MGNRGSEQAVYAVEGLHYHGTYEKLRESRDVKGLDKTAKGLIQFWIRGSRIQISPAGNVNIYYEKKGNLP